MQLKLKFTHVLLFVMLVLLLSMFFVAPEQVAYAAGNNCDLETLSVKDYKLNIAFDPSITNYMLTVPKHVKSIDITALPKDPNAEVTISDKANHLELGGQDVVILVKNNGNQKQYKITVTVQETSNLDGDCFLSGLYVSNWGISPKFSKTNFYYSLTIDKNNWPTVYIHPIKSNEKQTITINGNDVDPYNNDPLDCIYSYNISTGKNVFNIKVQAENGDSKTYQLTIEKLVKEMINTIDELVVRDAKTNKKLKINPEFQKDVFIYDVWDLDQKTKKIKFEVKLTSNKAKYTVSKFADDLKMGEAANFVEVCVTAENGAEQSYQFRVHRPQGNNNNFLQSLSINKYKMTPAFDKDVYEYNVNISWFEKDLELTYKTEDQFAVANVSNNAHNLDVGKPINKIEVIVTAANDDQRIYTINAHFSDNPDYIETDTPDVNNTPIIGSTIMPGGSIFGIPTWVLGIILFVVILFIAVISTVISIFVKRKYKVKAFNIKEYNNSLKEGNKPKGKNKVEEKVENNSEGSTEEQSGDEEKVEESSEENTEDKNEN